MRLQLWRRRFLRAGRQIRDEIEQDTLGGLGAELAEAGTPAAAVAAHQVVAGTVVQTAHAPATKFGRAAAVAAPAQVGGGGAAAVAVVEGRGGIGEDAGGLGGGVGDAGPA